MARKKRIGELPSGNIRRRIFVGYEYMEDDKGAPILDKYGHEQLSTDYSEFPDIKRKCPCCGAEYSFKLPELIASGDFCTIGVNGLGIGFNCAYCQMPIVVCANSEYNYENPPITETPTT